LISFILSLPHPFPETLESPADKKIGMSQQEKRSFPDHAQKIQKRGMVVKKIGGKERNGE
jgi:hypothetical protein